MASPQPIFRWAARHRRLVQAIGDALAWMASLTFADALRYDLHMGLVSVGGLVAILPLAVSAQVVSGLAVGLYLGRWRFGSFDEVAALACSAVTTSALLFVVDTLVIKPRMVPAGAVLAGGFLALVAMSAARYLWRMRLEYRQRPRDDGRVRLLVFGAGEGGAQVLTALLRDPDSPYMPVGLLDDDHSKRHRRILGIPVLGDRHHLATAAGDSQADVLLIAIPKAGAEVVSELYDLATEAGLQVKVLPPVGELYRNRVGVGDIRDVTEEDLLGRRPVVTDVASIAGCLTGKRVLVTGAGGSIGAELCRQIYRFAPAELIMLDRDESALHGVQLSIHGEAVMDSPALVLADIRDREAIRAIFDLRRPEVIFHAAALKHLALLERHPAEAIKSNVWGTLNVLEAADSVGVDSFVNISTDKAADPASVLGYSKHIAERLTAEVARRADGVFVSVRFGNVLGSRGSMLVTFRSQVESGGPLTVTDPDATRFFMTIPEAVELVIQAAAIGSRGETLVLDMGQPVSIDQVAKRLAARADRPVRIVYTGLRPGEKCHEVRFSVGEVDTRPVHPLISHVRVQALSVAAVRELQPGEPSTAGTLRDLCSADLSVAEGLT